MWRGEYVIMSVRTSLFNSDGLSQGDDCVAVQIVESLREEDVPSKWMFSMKAWHIHRVFLNNANLYDHDQ
jgi:hypothetical protein